MSDNLARILVTAAAEKQASLGFLKALIRAGRDGEAAVQRLVAEAARSAGCVVESVRYTPADVPLVEEFAGTTAADPGMREAILGRRAGSGGGRSVILFAHPDSEPPQKLETWQTDPFAGEVRDGRLYGWGVADDLAGVAIMVEALRVTLAAGVVPAGDVILASTPSKRHARGVAALLHRGVSADAALYLHPAESGAGMGEIKAITPGQLELRITVTGRQPPTTEPLQTGFAHLAVNPIDKAVEIIAALKRFDAERAARISHPALQDAVGRSTNVMLSSVEAGDAHRLSRVPERCVVGLAVSFPPPERASMVKADIEAVIAATVAADPWLSENPPQLAWDSGVSAAETPADHPLFVTAAAAVAAVTGRAPIVNPMHTGSDIRNPIVQKGIPTIGLGPLCGDLSQNGGHDEWVDVEDYLRAVSVAAATLAAWCDSTPA